MMAGLMSGWNHNPIVQQIIDAFLLWIRSIAQEESEIWLIQRLLNNSLIKAEGPQ